MDSSTAQVKVIFTTNEPDLQLPESKRQLLVPAGMRDVELILQVKIYRENEKGSN